MRGILKVALALAAIAPLVANAQLVNGDLLSFQAYYSDTNGTTPVGNTVFFQDGPGVSGTSGFPGTISASGNQVTFEYTGATVAIPPCAAGDSCLEGAYITIVTPANQAITSATLDAASTAPGFIASGGEVGAYNGGAFIQYQGLTATTGSTVVLDITASAVPEPSSYALMLAGMGLVGFAVRRRTALAR
jgi:hypothetical protein